MAGVAMRDLAVGFDHTCALGADRTLRCWGSNVQGQLGLGDTASRELPIEVPVGAFCPR